MRNFISRRCANRRVRTGPAPPPSYCALPDTRVSVQQILRHANVTTTMNIYVKMVSEDAAVAMKTLEANCATTVQQKRLVGAAEGNKTPMNCEQEISLSERFTEVLAEREGFESAPKRTFNNMQSSGRQF
jgi:hypothetical protein